MFIRIAYGDLNSRQQENYNFQKVAGRLADYGFNCLRLNDDWQGADFLAVHVAAATEVLKVQLKGRPVIDKKYLGKKIHVAFLDGNDCYVYPHDELVAVVETNVTDSDSWKSKGHYHWPVISKWMRDWLVSFKI
jgi:hypothetical protein